jgi:hypothetical protein
LKPLKTGIRQALDRAEGDFGVFTVGINIQEKEDIHYSLSSQGSKLQRVAQ